MSGNIREFKGNSIISLPDEFVIIDIETTGLCPQWDDIIELSAIKYNKEFEELGRFTELVQPPCDDQESGEFVSDFIAYLTGITNEMLKDAKTIDVVLPKYLDFIGSSFVVGYNVNFDVNFIYDNAEWIELDHFSNDFMDVMRLARKIHKDMKHHRLQDMAELYNVDYGNAHRSLADCIITKEVLTNLLVDGTQLFGSFEEIIKSSNPKALHFMEYDIKYFDDKEFLKIITGMIKFACNNNGGKIDLIRCAGFLGKSVKLIKLFLDLADECDIINIEEKNNLYYTVKMISMDNISSILHNPKYMEILNLAEECELYQKSLLEDDITDIDSMCNMIL